MGYEPADVIRKQKGPRERKVPHRRRGRKEWPPKEEKDEEEEEEEDGESGGEGGRRTRTEGPVPGQFLERFVRNFGRGGTLSSWYSNTVRVVGSMRGKKVKQRSAMNGIGY